MLDAPLKTIVDPARRPAAGAVIQDDYDLDCPWHSHDMHQLQYAFDDSIEVEDAHARYLLPRSLAAWIPAGVAHRTSLHRVRSGSILFAADLVQSVGERVRIIEASPLMREMMKAAMRWPLSEPQDGTGHAYFAALARLCAEWIGREAPLSLPSTREPLLQAAMTYTRTHLRDGDVAATCRAAGLSERTLRRLFASQAGMTWDEYRRRARLLTAAALLSDTRLPVGQIAAEVGFESQSAFSRTFRKLTGKTPRDWRSQ